MTDSVRCPQAEPQHGSYKHTSDAVHCNLLIKDLKRLDAEDTVFSVCARVCACVHA